MSGLIAIVDPAVDADSALQRAIAAAPGRGTLRAVWQGSGAVVGYQGSIEETAEQVAWAFHANDAYVCAVHGWPYVLATDQASGKRLSAEHLIACFVATGVLDATEIYGQYVILLWSIATKTLQVLRDVSGSLPLHWAATERSGVVHASDIRQVAAMAQQPLRLSLAVLSHYHQTLGLDARQDLYHHLHAYVPGQLSALRSGARSVCVLQKARSLEQLLPNFASEAAPADAENILLDAVRMSLAMCTGGREYALSLSGGMDSTLLWLCGSGLSQSMSGTGPGNRLGVGCEFPGRACDESPAIHAMLAATGTKNQYLGVRFEHPEFQMWRDTLFAASDYVPFPASQMTLQVARAARGAGRLLLLDGNGGDELFDWSLLEFAQIAVRPSEFRDLLMGLASPAAGPKWRALRHLLKRGARFSLNEPLNPRLGLIGRMLNPSTQRMFYLAAEQIATSQGVNLYSPLRDVRLMQLFSPWIARASFRNGRRRSLQSDAIFTLSDAKVRKERAQKVSFNEFADVPVQSLAIAARQMSQDQTALAQLGAAKLANVAGLMPQFLQYKINQGVLLAP